MMLALSTAGAVGAQDQAAAITFSQQELDQLLAPVALYPDTLLTQVLIAATYPLETVQAARFVSSHPNLHGDALAREVESEPWDASVKSLVQFPSVLRMMDDQLAWTQKLGDAFLAQQDAVMDTVQALRTRAQAAGTLQNNSQQRIVLQDRIIQIETISPEVIYVPYYNPTVVYGQWWWPDRQPMVWAPPVYRSPSYGNVIATGIAFGLGVAIVNSIFHDTRPDWREHHFVDYGRPFGNRQRPPGVTWVHNPEHRLGVAYRDAPTRQRFQPATIHDNRRDAWRGHINAASAPVNAPPTQRNDSRPSLPATPAPGQPHRNGNDGRPVPPPTPGIIPPQPGPTRPVPQPHPGQAQPAPQHVPGALPQTGPQPPHQGPAVPPGPPTPPAPVPPPAHAPEATRPPLPPHPAQQVPLPRQPEHPFMPNGSADAVRAHAERGRASREAPPPPRPAPVQQQPQPHPPAPVQHQQPLQPPPRQAGHPPQQAGSAAHAPAQPQDKPQRLPGEQQPRQEK